jgi:lysozyme family protein
MANFINALKGIGADASVPVSIIQAFEGGQSSDPNDLAARDTPPGTTVHTNKGITWTTWKQVFGDSADSVQRFLTMSQNDWLTVYYKYWNAINGDKINNQAVANTLLNFAWLSPGIAVATVQKILSLTPDNIAGDDTVAAINAADAATLNKQIIQAEVNYYKSLNSPYVDAWVKRAQSFDVPISQDMPQTATLPTDKPLKDINVPLFAAIGAIGLMAFFYAKARRKRRANQSLKTFQPVIIQAYP